jgi:hypothetical protein
MNFNSTDSCGVGPNTKWPGRSQTLVPEYFFIPDNQRVWASPGDMGNLQLIRPMKPVYARL